MLPALFSNKTYFSTAFNSLPVRQGRRDSYGCHVFVCFSCAAAMFARRLYENATRARTRNGKLKASERECNVVARNSSILRLWLCSGYIIHDNRL